MGEAGSVHQVQIVSHRGQEQTPPISPNMLEEGWAWQWQADTCVSYY